MSQSKELLKRCLNIIEQQVSTLATKGGLSDDDHNRLCDYTKVLNTLSEKDLGEGDDALDISTSDVEKLDEIIENGRKASKRR